MSAQVTLVLVHGILSSGEKWAPLVDLLLRDDDLAGRVKPMEVEYPSKLIEFGPTKRIPDLDTVADFLRTRVAEDVAPDHPIVFAGHSQGGLIIQRYLAQELHAGRGTDLGRVRRVMMFATPNGGSEFLLPLRRWWGRHPQEKELRPLHEKIIDTQSTILRQVVNARDLTATTAPIPVEAFAGMSDRVVTPQSARAVFPYGGALEGDHSTVVVPKSNDALVYKIIKARLLRAIEENQPGTAEGRADAADIAVRSLVDAQRATPLGGFRPDDDAIRVIAEALAEVEDFIETANRRQFIRLMPRFIRERQETGSGPARVQLLELVHVCATFEDAGRQALVVNLRWGWENVPAAQRALDVIDSQWPDPGEDASHTG